ncbi:MAG TPA: Hint domain-containing protein, partial [Stellaceae bacterium]|nr:Hint domain-containing protein [Stellaceae bacterium]
GTDITPACFVRGTRILTEAGEAAVEDLAIGDRVVTMSGMARPIKWIGRRSYDRRFIAGNRGVLPIRITAGALADGVPSRELWVSPQHALYLDGALVPAEHLVNNLTIVQEEHVERVEYFHIELDSHDVIFAEGVAAESYVECDNRGVFHNAGEFALLYPEAEPACWTFCAPRLEAGTDEAVAIRARIARRAGQPEGPAADRMTAAQARDLRPADGRVAGCVLPTGWRWWSKAGLSCEVVGRGRQDGIAYVDVRVFGTPKATTHANQILLTGSSEIPVRHGECWQAGAHVGLSGGSLHNVQAVEIAANLNAAEGGYSSWFGATFVTPLDGAATRRRGGRRFVQRHFARSGTITDRAAAYLQPLLQIATIEGAAVDLTLRIGHPSATRLAPTELPEQRRTAA